MAEKCDFWNQNLWDWGKCKGSETISDATNDAVAKAAKSLSDSSSAMMRWLNTWWMEAPQPDVDAEPILQVVGDLTWYTAAFAIIGFLFALGKMVLSQDFKTMIGGIQPVINLIIVTACYAVGITWLLEAGDGLAGWLLDRASTAANSPGDISALAVVTLAGPTLGGGGWLIFALVEIVGSVINFAFMLFRNIIVPVLMVFLPTLAAASGTEAGKQAFAKANGYLLAFITFKPVAAVIYALGLWFMSTPAISGMSEDGVKSDDLDLVGAVVGVSTGLGIMFLAALALPALIKFLVPVAARGAGGFSGGAAMAGAVTVAAGAAVIAGTGGAGAAAGGSTTAATTGGGSTAAAGGGAGATAAGSGAAPPGGGAGAAASGGGGAGGGAAGGGKPGGASTGSGGSGSSGASDSGDSGGGSTSGGGPGGAAKPEGSGTDGSGSGSGDTSAGGAGVSSGDSGTDSAGAAQGSKSSDGDSTVSDRAAIANIVSEAAAGGGSSVEKAIEDE